MTKIRINRRSILTKVAEKISQVEGATKGDQLLGEIGTELLLDTQARARTGKGFTADTVKVFGSKRTNLPGLAQSTVSSRESVASRNPTPAFYRKNKSNLTLTGQLLDSLRLFIKRGVIIIRPDGERRPYKTGRPSKAKTPPNNEELSTFLEEKGFYFLGIDDKSLKKIKTISTRFIRRLLIRRR